MKIKSPSDHPPPPLKKKSKSLHVLPSSQNMPNMYTLYNPLPHTCTWTPDHGLRRRWSCSSCQSPQRPPFLKNFWIRDMMWCWSFTFVGQIASTCTSTCICILHPLPRNIGFLRFPNMLFYLFFKRCYVPVEVCSVFVH